MKKIIIIMIMLLFGCVNAQAKKSVKELQVDFKIYQRAVVPHPDYNTDSAKKEVETLGKVIEEHIRVLNEVLK